MMIVFRRIAQRLYRPAVAPAAGLLLVLAVGLLIVTGVDARSSRDDLIARMMSSLSEELPEGIKGIAIMQFENGCGAPVDIDLLREDLEIELIHASRFDFINRALLEAALAEMDLCSGMQCFMDPATLQKFGKAKGIDAMLIGEVIDSSTRYPGLGDQDYFTTVLLRAISTSTASVVWQKEVMGVNTESVVDILGGLPEQQAVTREEAFGREVADFLSRSVKMRQRKIKTISLMAFENRSDTSVDMLVLFRYLTNSVVSRTDLKLIDRKYMEAYLKEQGLWFDRITEAAQRKSIGKLYGIDAFIYGTIRAVTDDRIECVVRINDVETNVDIDADKLTAAAENMEWYLPDMLRNVGPSRFNSEPGGASVAVDGQPIGTAPCSHQLANGEHEVAFELYGYESAVKAVVCNYGQGRNIHADLELAYSQVAILSTPAGARVKLNGEPRGKAPVRGLSLPYGEYKVRTSRDMFEDASKTFTVDGPQHEFLISLKPKTRGRAIRYSMLLPGLGQLYKGHGGKGWLFMLGAAGSAGFAVISESARKSAVDDYEAAREEYLDAVRQEEMDAVFGVMREKWDEAESKKLQRDIGWCALAGIWAINMIDAALGWPAADAGVTAGLAPSPSGSVRLVVTVRR